MQFTKMHGLGNDYLYHYGELKQPEKTAVKWSDRHFGIGSDGIILITRSDIADFKMRIFNADGSEAKMCGNGIRCVGKYVYEKGYTDKENLQIETASGIRSLHLETLGGRVKRVTVVMGKAEVSDPETLAVGGETVTCIPVSVGNPHAVVFTEDAEHAPLETTGALLEKHEFFPGGVNVEFVEKINRNTLRMRVWERGSGVTMACGTGACASAAAAVKSGICPPEEEITVLLDGGKLQITVHADFRIVMTGTADTICECEVQDL